MLASSWPPAVLALAAAAQRSDSGRKRRNLAYATESIEPWNFPRSMRDAPARHLDVAHGSGDPGTTRPRMCVVNETLCVQPRR